MGVRTAQNIVDPKTGLIDTSRPGRLETNEEAIARKNIIQAGAGSEALAADFPEEDIFKTLTEGAATGSVDQLLANLFGGTTRGIAQAPTEEQLQTIRQEILQEEIDKGVLFTRTPLEEITELPPDFELKIRERFAEQQGFTFDQESGQFFQESTIPFEETAVGRLGELTDIEQDPRIGDLSEQLVQQIGGQGEQVAESILVQAAQTGAVTESELSQIQQLQQQQGGSLQQSAESILGPGGIQNRLATLEQQVPGAIDPAIQAALQLAGGTDPTSQASQFGDQLAAAIETTQGLSTQIPGQAEDLIRAQGQQSRIEEEQALQGLRDSLAARGIVDSGAAIAAETDLQGQFSRQRNVEAARLRAQAQQQQVQQQLSAQQTIGSLAQAGAGAQAQARGQQLAAAQAAGQLGLQGLQARGGLAGQQFGNILGLGGLQQQGVGQLAGLFGRGGELGRGGAQEQAGFFQRIAGIAPGVTGQQQQALLQQQGIGQATQQQTFENLRALQQAQLQPFALALGQAGATTRQEQAGAANIAQARIGARAQGQAGLGGLAGSFLQAITALLGGGGGGRTTQTGGGGGFIGPITESPGFNIAPGTSVSQVPGGFSQEELTDVQTDIESQLEEQGGGGFI